MADNEMNDAEKKIFELQRKAKMYYGLNTAVHVVDGSASFFNGFISEPPDNEDFFIIDDRKIGPVPIFYREVDILDRFVGDLNSLKRDE